MKLLDVTTLDEPTVRLMLQMETHHKPTDDIVMFQSKTYSRKELAAEVTRRVQAEILAREPAATSPEPTVPTFDLDAPGMSVIE
jgi:hypothetical protein